MDVGPALRQHGVVAAFTGADLDISLPTHAVLNPVRRRRAHYALARDKVRHVGEAVAVVLAEDRYVARDAADLVDVAYEPLPAAASLQAALADGAPRDPRRLSPATCTFATPRDQGDAEAAFRHAAHVVRLDMFSQRLNALPMEPRAVAAEHRRGDGTLTVWSSNQVPHTLRSSLAALLGMSESRVRVIAPDVGGGFGAKLQVYPEELLVAWAARRLGRPIKWAEERRECMLALSHGRGQEVV